MGYNILLSYFWGLQLHWSHKTVVNRNSILSSLAGIAAQHCLFSSRAEIACHRIYCTSKAWVKKGIVPIRTARCKPCEIVEAKELNRALGLI